MISNRSARVTLCLAASLVAAVAASPALARDNGPAGPSPGAAPGKPPGAQPPGSNPAFAAPRESAAQRLARNSWWNNRIGDELKLSADQKKKFDGTVEAWVEANRKRQEDFAGAHEAIRAALLKSDWSAARTAVAKQGDIAVAIMKSQIDLQIDVLSGLTADQRKQLADLHPNMLATPWIRAGGPAMTRREAAAPSAPTPPAAAPPR